VADEQKIQGVPEGWRLIGFKNGVKYPDYVIGEDGEAKQWPSDLPSKCFYAVIERIPKPKRKVALAEFVLRDGETLSSIRGVIFGKDEHCLESREPDAIRIEERDA
jgi:hypothetical protein